MIGKTVGKYQILERLGRGGMGTVYKALDETLDRVVAIKVLNPDLGDAELLKRFRTEAISLARLNHPGIATIYELHRHDDDLLMVMEFLRGETLQKLSERLGPLEPPQAAHICIQILDALAHAHRAGVIHRDLKPANVMITDAGLVKVMDFGIARMLGGEHLTHTGYMMGTPAYMAPEQVLGKEIDGRADLYSVGVLFYRLLSRELPFRADTAISMAQKQVAELPTPIATFRPDLPPWCESVISKALAKAPADRFQTPEAFRAALTAAVTPANLGDLPTMATPTALDLTMPQPVGPFLEPATNPPDVGATGVTASTGTSAAPAPAAATPISTATSPVERTGPSVVLGTRHLVSLAALLLVLVAGIAIFGYAALKRGDGASQTAVVPPAAPAFEPARPEGQPEQQPAAVTGSQPPVPAPAETPTPPAPAPPAATPSTKPAPSSQADSAARKAKAASKAPEIVPPPPEPVAAPPEPTPPPAPPAAPEVAPITFKAVKLLVQQGNTLRDRDAVLTLTGDHLSVLDRSGKTEILSVPYASIQQAYYSRSKQPKWKSPDGTQQEADVDLGKMSFFRGERNWLILVTQASPVFIRFEDADLRTVLPAVQERSGVKIQR
jgi:serine/threonine-protein kinase